MPIILEIIGGFVFVGVLMLGVYKAAEWYRRHNKEVPTNDATNN